MGRVLLGREHLLQQRAQLRLAEHAARLDVGQQVLQIADALRQRLHLAQPLVHLLQPVGHLLERFAQARLQGGLQFFIHRLAHLVELGGVGGLQLGELLLQRAAHLGDAARVGFTQGLELLRQRFRQRAAQVRELLREGVDLRVLRARGLGRLLRHAKAQRLQLLHQGVAQRAAQLCQLRAQRVDLRVLGAQSLGALAHHRVLKRRQRVRQLLPPFARADANLLSQLTLQPLAVLADGRADQLLHLPARGHVVGSARALQQQHQHKQQVQAQRGQGQPENPVGPRRTVHLTPDSIASCALWMGAGCIFYIN